MTPNIFVVLKIIATNLDYCHSSFLKEVNVFFSSSLPSLILLLLEQTTDHSPE
jgi:hypothetical protein